MAITHEDAVRIASAFVKERGWQDWWSLKRLSVRQAEHPESQCVCWCVTSVPGAVDVPIATVWLDRESGGVRSASRNGFRSPIETWPDA